MNDIHGYYVGFSEETRLVSDRQHYCEFLISMHLLRKYLSLDGARILDCCAGTGIYAFALAAEGVRVTAGDLVSVHTDKMRLHPDAAKLDEIYTGSAVDLTRFADEFFDAVLCMGALYHLDAEGRSRCIRECLRVLRPGGLLACAWESQLSLYLGQHMRAVRQTTAASRREAFEALDACCRTRRRGIFYGMTFDEVEAFPDVYPMDRVTNAATYPALYAIFPDVDGFSEEEYDRYMQCLYETCEDELSAKYAMHGLYLGRKR